MSLYCQFERDQSEQSSRQPAFIGMLIEHGAIRFRHWSREKSKGNHTVGFRIKSHRSTTRRMMRDNTPSKEATPNGSVMSTRTGFITRRDAAGLNEAVSTSTNAAIDPHERSERTSMALHYRCLLRAGVGLPGSPARGGSNSHTLLAYRAQHCCAARHPASCRETGTASCRWPGRSTARRSELVPCRCCVRKLGEDS